MKIQTFLRNQAPRRSVIRSGVVVVSLALAVGLVPQTLAQSSGQSSEKTTLTKAAAARHKAPLVVAPAESAPRYSELAPRVAATIGKSSLIRLPEPMVRISVANPDVADIVLTQARELYLLGKKVGSTNVILWGKSGQSLVMDVDVGMDTAGLRGRIQQLLPGEKNIQITAAGDALILSGEVSDAVKADNAVELAKALGAKKVVNMMRVAGPQQVMLEVRVAEVSKTLNDMLGVSWSKAGPAGSWTYSILSNFLSGGQAALTMATKTGSVSLTIDALKKEGLVKILAEPSIMAISGQEGSFLSGGKIYIPVNQGGTVGGTSTVTLEEKEFGVGLRFLPTVLEGGRINLRVTPEVSELAAGSQLTSNNITTILPTITTRRASTTVQLMDGQSFAIAGLIKNNVTEQVKAIPGLGEIPVLGALFRSSDFQNDRTELVFIVTPHLVKPLPANYTLPTDHFVTPTPSEFLLGGKLEGSPKQSEVAAAPSAPPAPAAGGFEMR